jgi:hypothetical protein
VPTCTNGHYLSGGTAFCGVCGDDVRPRCDQGHPGKVGARFCATCGGPIAAPGPARVTGPGLPGSVRPTADDMTPLLTTLPAAGPPPSSSTLNGQLPVSYPAPPGPSLGDSPPAAPWDRQAERTTGSGFAPSPQARPPQAGGGPGRPPATIELPRTGTESPAPGGRHRGGPPPGADRGGQAPEVGETPTPRTRSRRVLILGLTLGLVVVAGGGAAAAIMLLHHPAKRLVAAVATPSPTHPPASATPSSSATAATPSPSSAAVGPGGWTYPKPIDQQAYGNDTATINSVSCVTAVTCFAVDSDGNVLASTAVNSWQTVDTDTEKGLTSISCASSHFCAAVDNSGDVILYSGGAWSDPVSIDSGNELTSVSCPTSTFCVAVDNQGHAFTFTGSATAWSRAVLDPNQDDIASVSCPSSNFCAAVDQSGNAYTYDGDSWSPADNIDSGNEFTQVSCYSDAFCVAVDNSANAAVMTDGGWSVDSMPSTGAGVACPAAGYCVAVDTSGGALIYQQAGWSKVSKVDGNNAFAAISCTGVNTCTAADRYDNVIYYRASLSG